MVVSIGAPVSRLSHWQWDRSWDHAVEQAAELPRAKRLSAGPELCGRVAKQPRPMHYATRTPWQLPWSDTYLLNSCEVSSSGPTDTYTRAPPVFSASRSFNGTPLDVNQLGSTQFYGTHNGAHDVSHSGTHGGAQMPLMAPPPVEPPMNRPEISRQGSWPAMGPATSNLHARIRTKGARGPSASDFSGAISFLWFSTWPEAKAYMYQFEAPQGNARVFAESLARPEFVQYTRCLVEKADISEEVLTLALLLVYRFRELQAQRPRGPMDRHPTSEARVVVVALMTANKFLDDISYTTQTWSKMSGLELRELKRMEAEFLTGLDFKLHVSAREWAAWEHTVKTLLYPAVGALLRHQS